MSIDVILCMKFAKHVTGMFGWGNDWQIAELKVVSLNSKNFGKWIDFSHMGTNDKLNLAG